MNVKKQLFQANLPPSFNSCLILKNFQASDYLKWKYKQGTKNYLKLYQENHNGNQT